MTRIGRTRAASVGLLLLVLAAGFSMGIAWDQRLHAASIDEAPAEEVEEPKGRDFVIDQVGLVADQSMDVERIIEHYRAEMEVLNDKFHSEYTPLRKALVKDTRDSIHAVLTPEQSAVYDSLLTVRSIKREANRDQDEDEDY